MNVTYGPESGEGDVTITITPTGEAHFVEPDETQNGEELLIDLPGSACMSWVEIDVEVTVVSAGGALDESFETVLRAHSPHATSLYVSIKPEDFGGDFGSPRALIQASPYRSSARARLLVVRRQRQLQRLLENPQR